MQVSKWGNSLAVRLPRAVVDALDLKEGDQIEIRIARERVFEVSRDQSKPQALARLRKLRRPLPPGFVFDREEANARYGLLRYKCAALCRGRERSAQRASGRTPG